MSVLVSVWTLRLLNPLLHSQFGLEAEVGIALHHCCVPTPTNSKQFNRLRSFPSKIRVPEVFAKIKNYPVSSCSKFSHYSASIILLEVSFRFHNHWLHVVVFYSLDVALF